MTTATPCWLVFQGSTNSCPSSASATASRGILYKTRPFHVLQVGLAGGQAIQDAAHDPSGAVACSPGCVGLQYVTNKCVVWNLWCDLGAVLGAAEMSADCLAHLAQSA